MEVLPDETLLNNVPVGLFPRSDVFFRVWRRYSRQRVTTFVASQRSQLPKLLVKFGAKINSLPLHEVPKSKMASTNKTLAFPQQAYVFTL
jgi:hypothetical protein